MTACWRVEGLHTPVNDAIVRCEHVATHAAQDWSAGRGGSGHTDRRTEGRVKRRGEPRSDRVEGGTHRELICRLHSAFPQVGVTASASETLANLHSSRW
jgi:hypothetical protein